MGAAIVLKRWARDTHQVAALKGDIYKGLFFRGSDSLPFGSEIRSVDALIEFLLTPRSHYAA